MSKFEKINNYIIGKTIGKGSFGKVKLAKHILTNEKVAIKILEKSAIKNDKDLKKINREIKILKQLNHPNVIKLYEIIETTNKYYLIMEYSAGGELFNYITENIRIKEKEASFLFYQIIKGLEEIHKNQICHRDLKPENILLSKNKKIIKIIDFGLSNFISKNTLLTSKCGSPNYVPPEIIIKNEYNGIYIDIWCCGIILYAMVFGFLPFDDIEMEVLFNKIIKCNVQFYQKDIFNISSDCIDLIKKILKFNPKDRISLQDILKHPFITKFYSSFNLDNYLFLNNEKDIDKKIIDYMIKELKIHNDSHFIEKNVKNNRHNHITTTFRLLKQKYEEGKLDFKNNKSLNEEKEENNNEEIINIKIKTRNKNYNNKKEDKMNITSDDVNNKKNPSLKDLDLSKVKEKENNIIINNIKLLNINKKENPIFEKLLPTYNEENNNENNNKNRKKIDTSVSTDKKNDLTKSNSPVHKNSTKTISTEISNNEIKEEKINNKNKYKGKINVIQVNIFDKNKIINHVNKKLISTDSKNNNKNKENYSTKRVVTPIKDRKDNKLYNQISPIKNVNYEHNKILNTENNEKNNYKTLNHNVNVRKINKMTTLTINKHKKSLSPKNKTSNNNSDNKYKDQNYNNKSNHISKTQRKNNNIIIIPRKDSSNNTETNDYLNLLKYFKDELVITEIFISNYPNQVINNKITNICLKLNIKLIKLDQYKSIIEREQTRIGLEIKKVFDDRWTFIYYYYISGDKREVNDFFNEMKETF